MVSRAAALAAPLLAMTAALYTAPAALAAPTPSVSEGTLLPYRPGATAITYDSAVVPPGATAELTITNLPYGTEVRLTTTGLMANRMYGAHLHTHPCTAVPQEAGPHHQHHKDPKAAPGKPSVNPVYANPRNETWLDFTADGTGAGSAAAAHGWDFDPADPPRSLVIHTDHTKTGPGEAGKAGARAACLTLATV